MALIRNSVKKSICSFFHINARKKKPPLPDSIRSAAFLLMLVFNINLNAGVENLETAANSLLNSLSSTQITEIQYELKSNARATWSNLPTFLSPPAGIMMSGLSNAQRKQVHKMLQSSLSSQGYHKASSIIRLDDVLHEIEKRTIESGAGNVAMAKLFVNSRSSLNYSVALFGSPKDKNWGWKLTGHHLAINVTINDQRISVTPGFYGSNPRIVSDGAYSGFSPLAKEHELALSFVEKLSVEQLNKAIISKNKPNDIFEGPGRRGSITNYEGLKSQELNSSQLADLQRLILEFVKNGNAQASSDHLDAIASAGWQNLWFSWRGPVSRQEPFYYRIHGERLLIEYDLQNSNHDHAVVRDPQNDYGEDWLAHHYKEKHPSQKEVMNKLGL